MRRTLSGLALCASVWMGATTCGGQVFVSGSAAFALHSAALAAGPDDADTTSAVGLTFRDPEIAAAIAEFEAGKSEEAMARLSKLINDKSRNEAQRNGELRAALAMLQIRDGSKEMRSKSMAMLGNITNGQTDLARRAQVIKLMGLDRIKEGGPGIAELKSRENWLERLRIVRQHLSNKIDEKDTAMEDKVDKPDGYARIKDTMSIANDESAVSIIMQMNVIKVEEDKTRETVQRHASRMRNLIKSINNQINGCKAKMAPLLHEYHNPREPGKKADARNQYNRCQTTCKGWWDAGRAVIKHYDEMVAKQVGVSGGHPDLEDCPQKLP